MGRACKPDSVRLSNADGHFSTATLARCVTLKVAPERSSQPENSPGRVFRFRVFRFLLGLAPNGGYHNEGCPSLVLSYAKVSHAHEKHRFISTTASRGLTVVSASLWPCPAA